MDIPTLILDLENASEKAREQETLEGASLTYNQLLAAAIDKFVKTGIVKTTGTASAQTGNIT